jgi:hypothetical protein
MVNLNIHKRRSIRLKDYDLPCEIDLMNAFRQYYYVYVLQFEIVAYLIG